VIEGLAIAALTVGASRAFLATKSSFTLEIGILRRALAGMRAAGLAGDVPIRLVRGPDPYLFGEEKALLEVVEGEEPLPRRDPPYGHGLFASGPQMGWSARDGVDAGGEADQPDHRQQRRGPGDRPPHPRPRRRVVPGGGDVGLAGHHRVHRGRRRRPPRLRRARAGTPLRRVIERVGGGPRPGRTIKAVFSGVANGVITADHVDVPVTCEDLGVIGSGLGSAGFIVYDDTADIVSVARTFARFLHVESCGQCGACKLHSAVISDTLAQLERTATQDHEIEDLGARLRLVTDQNRCYFPVELQTVNASILRAFPERLRRPPRGHRGPTSPLPAPQDRRHGQRNRHLRRQDRPQASRLDLRPRPAGR